MVPQTILTWSFFRISAWSLFWNLDHTVVVHKHWIIFNLVYWGRNIKIVLLSYAVWSNRDIFLPILTCTFCRKLYLHLLNSCVHVMLRLCMMWILMVESFIVLQDMNDMRDCYDGLLSAAAATANSVYGILLKSFYMTEFLFMLVYLLGWDPLLKFS